MRMTVTVTFLEDDDDKLVESNTEPAYGVTYTAADADDAAERAAGIAAMLAHDSLAGMPA